MGQWMSKERKTPLVLSSMNPELHDFTKTLIELSAIEKCLPLTTPTKVVFGPGCSPKKIQESSLRVPVVSDLALLSILTFGINIHGSMAKWVRFGLLPDCGDQEKAMRGEQDIGLCSKFSKMKIFVILSSRRVYDIKGSVKCSNASDSTHVPLIEWSLSVFACWGSWFAASPAFLDAARAWPVEATVCLAMAPAVALIVLLWLCPWLAGYAPGLLYDALASAPHLLAAWPSSWAV
ncbi:hypothetical protein E3N88_00488 [Mikania micrantha]|uniref:Uncharacterized protein n=1 Tax=Mikania micrantha TaxID=192012 RepID=A0A5N6PYK8_9ASTR|nr:hypothetical protein E3N88_00488 [Mikania micrantha]